MWTPISKLPAGEDENNAFQAWLVADSEVAKHRAEVTLLFLLRKHATAIIWTKMNRVDPSLANKAIMQIWQNIHTFRGESAFSTWAHKVISNVVGGEVRETANQRLEQAIEDGEEPAVYPDTTWRMLYEKVKRSLIPEEQELIQCKLEGMTASEIAVRLGVSRAVVEWKWGTLKEKIRVMAG